MPRSARTVVASYPHHVIQRGNNKQDVFFDEADRTKYFELLKKYSEKWNTSVMAYCLMTNHVHLLLRPKEDDSLNKTMQGVSLCYTQYANRKYGRTGRLWESRFHSCVVDSESYLWAVARYIETNPVRARMADRAETYPYSSARAHVTGEKDGLLGEELFDETQREDYRGLLASGLPDEVIKAVRSHTRTGRPLGKEGFITRMEEFTGLDLSPKRRGRPKRERAED